MFSKSLWNDIYEYVKKNKIALFVVTLLAVISYFAFMFGDMYNADSFTYGVFYHSDHYGWENNQGRFFLRFWDLWRDRMILPSLIIGVSIFFLLLSVVLLWNIFEINNTFSKILLGIFVICSPSVADLFTYTYTADAYCFAFFLAVLAGWLLVRGQKRISGVLAVPLLVIVLGIYQVYIGVTITICSFWLMMKLLENRMDGRTIFQRMIKFLLSGISSVVIYWVLFTILDKIKYLTKTSGRGATHAISNAFGNIFSGIKQIYQVFLEYFFCNTIVYNSWHGRKYINIIVAVLIMVAFLFIVIKRRTWTSVGRILCCCGLLLMLPIMLEIVILMAPDANVYAETGILILGYMNFFYILLVLLGEMASQWKMQLISWIPLTYIAILLCVFVGIFTRMLQAESNKFQMLAYGMEARLESLEDYQSGMKVMVVGRPQRGNYPFVDDTYKTITKGMISDYSLTFGRADQVANSWIELFKYYCGVNYEGVTEQELEQILNSEELQDMENYPAENCARRIGDIAVIRLSE